MSRTSYSGDWSPIPTKRWDAAQGMELEYWSRKDRFMLTRDAEFRFYAGFYAWTTRRELLDPFRVDPDQPENFQIPADAMDGSVVLELGCGPASRTLSLVHCATVHALDPLADFYRELQPFGWEYFASVTAGGAERLPYDAESFQFVHCWNVLSHTQDPGRILDEIARVLVPQGQLLVGCDLRGDRADRPQHPFKWSVEAFEERVYAGFEPVTPVSLSDNPERAVRRWVGRLQKKA